MGTICQDYSNIAINYNYETNESLSLTSNQTIGQTFVLPDDYVRGSDPDERRIPELTGFQILVTIADGESSAASLDWSLGFSLVDNPTVQTQFDFVQNGTTTGAYKDGLTWFDVIFDNPVVVTQEMLNAIWIIVITPSDISSVPYFTYTNQGYNSKIQGYELIPAFTKVTTEQFMVTPINDNVSSSFNFRVLCLGADSGTDFLGNQYRSIVTLPNKSIGTAENGDGYWLSPALPAADAVASLYFDMRPVMSVPRYGLVNLVPNPSFEYDSGTSIADWNANSNGMSNTFEIETGNAPYGTNSLHMRVDNITGHDYIQAYSSNIPINPGQTYSGGAVITINTSSGSGILAFNWYDSTDTEISSAFSNQLITTVNNSSQSTLVATSPINAAYVVITIMVSNDSDTTQSVDFNIDGICLYEGNKITDSGNLPSLTLYPSPSLLPLDDSRLDFFDGDTPGCKWSGTPGNSISMQMTGSRRLNQSAVVDGLILDPLFPNMHYTVYSSNDDNGIESPTTTDDWEQKLWTRHYTSTTSLGGKLSVLDSPINAKYIKIELTNPQLHPYNPGNIQLPIEYKTFPSWVQNYFLAQVQYPSYDVDQVIVQSDALTSLYNPDLSELMEKPSIPSVTTPNTYSVRPSSDFDTTTMSQINIDSKPYRDPLGSQAAYNTILGNISILQNSNMVNGAQQVSEGDPPQYPMITTVSSLQRDSVLADLLSPNMYFFYTCRHAYMHKTAMLSSNQAYFLGINDVTFLRVRGDVPSDVSVYTETGADMANSTVNDFTLTTQGWWETYDAS